MQSVLELILLIMIVHQLSFEFLIASKVLQWLQCSIHCHFHEKSGRYDVSLRGGGSVCIYNVGGGQHRRVELCPAKGQSIL